MGRDVLGWDHFPVAAGDVITELLVHSKEEFISIGLMESISECHGVRVSSDKSKYVLAHQCHWMRLRIRCMRGLEDTR